MNVSVSILRAFLRSRLIGFFRKNSKVCISKDKRNALRIHVGCGPIDLAGWVNVDARPFPHVHIASNSVTLAEFADGAVGEIYLCHVLEHFSFEEVDELLATYQKKLSSGGVLRLSVPDFDLAIAAYQASGDDLEFIRMSLMGGQDYEFNYHKSIFNEKLLTKLLVKAGFSEVLPWSASSDFGCELGDWSDGQIKKKGIGAYPISLNLKAVK
jgi:predicted SAM-dependent methyltransferase